jgi:peptide/nickel transport system substrate-binding protein
MKRRLVLLSSLAVIIAMMTAYFATPLQSAQAQGGKTLRVAFAQEPDNLNGYYTTMAFATWATFLQQANLFDYDENFKPIPRLVTEIPSFDNGGISKDGKVLTFKLKKDLKWSDGSPLTAEDVAFSYEMLKDKGNNMLQGGNITGTLQKVEKVDDLTVKLTFSEPQPYPENIGGPTNFFLLPAKVLKPVYDKDKSIEKADWNLNPTVFSGPYTLKEWKRGEVMTLVANPNFVSGKPKIDTIQIRFFAEPESSYQALAAGQIDWIPNLQSADSKKIGDLTKDVTFYQLNGSYQEFLVFNVRKADQPRAGHPALQDVNVRKAIRLGVDREKLVKDALFGLASVTDSLYDSVKDYVSPEIKFVKADKAAAEKLLDDAGWKKGADGIRAKDGVKLELRYVTTTAAQRKQNQAVIQQQLGDIGIKIVLENKPASEFFGAFANGGTLAIGEYDLAEFANNTVTTNPVAGQARALMCEERVSEAKPGGQNNSGYCNEKMDAAVKAVETSLDKKVALDGVATIQKLMYDEVPQFTLYNRDDIYAYITSRFAAKPRIGAGILNMWFDVGNWDLK